MSADAGTGIQVNGESRVVSRGITVSMLLATLELKPWTVVVERNGEIMDRARFDDTVVSEGDVYELVHFVGGGR